MCVNLCICVQARAAGASGNFEAIKKEHAVMEKSLQLLASSVKHNLMPSKVRLNTHDHYFRIVLLQRFYLNLDT